MASVTVAQLTKKFGAFTALHSIDLDMDDGEFVVFVGPSGSGKSTLLRCIAGLEQIASGTVRIAGQDVTNIEWQGLAVIFDFLFVKAVNALRFEEDNRVRIANGGEQQAVGARR